MKREQQRSPANPVSGLRFGQFFARWLRFRRDDMILLLGFPAAFWLLILLVTLGASIAEGEVDPGILSVSTAMALVGGIFAGFIAGYGSAGAGFTLAVCWGQPRRYAAAALWLSGILYSAVNLLLAALLQALGSLIGLTLGVQGLVDLLPRVPLVLWLLLLVMPTAAATLLKVSLRRFGPKAGGWLYLIFLVAMIGVPNLDNVMGTDLRPAAFALLGAAVLAAAVEGSVWLLRAPVGGDTPS